MQMTPRLMRRFAGLLLAAFACLVLASPAHAQWKWRDSRGQIHVSDIPPPRDIPDKDVLGRPDLVVRRPVAPTAPASAASAVAVAKPGTDPQLEEKRRLAEQQQAAQERAEQKKVAEQRKENCDRARINLSTLESGRRMAYVLPNGETVYMDDSKRTQETERARAAVNSECR
jgi:hypothetical protein